MLSEIDIDNYYKEQFNIEEVCHVCNMNKKCIKDGIEGSQVLGFICYECEEKRYEAEKERKRLMSASNLALAIMGL